MVIHVYDIIVIMVVETGYNETEFKEEKKEKTKEWLK